MLSPLDLSPLTVPQDDLDKWEPSQMFSSNANMLWHHSWRRRREGAVRKERRSGQGSMTCQMIISTRLGAQWLASGLESGSSVDGLSLLLLWRRCSSGTRCQSRTSANQDRGFIDGRRGLCFRRCGRKTGCWHFSDFFFCIPPSARWDSSSAKQMAASDGCRNVDDIHGRVKREISSDFSLNKKTTMVFSVFFLPHLTRKAGIFWDPQFKD